MQVQRLQICIADSPEISMLQLLNNRLMKRRGRKKGGCLLAAIKCYLNGKYISRGCGTLTHFDFKVISETWHWQRAKSPHPRLSFLIKESQNPLPVQFRCSSNCQCQILIFPIPTSLPHCFYVCDHGQQNSQSFPVPHCFLCCHTVCTLGCLLHGITNLR